MHFDDGSNPWLETENTVKIFTFGALRSRAIEKLSVPYLYIMVLPLGFSLF